MTPVPLVRVVRNGLTECVHHGSIVMTGPTGEVLLAAGDIDTPVFPRSANKPFQATVALEAGAALADETLAIAAASHSGEDRHVAVVLRLLEQNGLSEADLQCPADWPGHRATRDEVVRSGGGRARRYMNCSGKHAGMLAACVAAGWDTASYLDPTHPLQRAITARVEQLAGEPVAAVGVDGCGAPVLALTLTGLARAFGAVAAAPTGSAAARVSTAMRTHPFLVAGSGREDTEIMGAHTQLLLKGGAEGVHCAALPDGTAIAMKITDGAERARMPVMVALLQRWGLRSDILGRWATAPVLGGGEPVGVVEVIPGALSHA